MPTLLTLIAKLKSTIAVPLHSASKARKTTPKARFKTTLTKLQNSTSGKASASSTNPHPLTLSELFHPAPRSYPFSTMALPISLVFSVKRREPELVGPAKPTPHESKQLSDIDDQAGLRCHIQMIQIYGNSPLMRGRDPVKVIREALAQTLVYYYPFAGRLREGPGGKLIVECTGEGVMFTEADADVTLQQFGDEIRPPFPCMEELLHVVPGSGEVLGCPLLLIQVTRLKCGGFIFALRLNHTMADGIGLVQFMTAVGEMARGEPAPSIPPVWQRHLLNARDPPRVTCTHHEYNQVPRTNGSLLSYPDTQCRIFFFGPTEVSTLRSLLPPHLGASCSAFEVVTACMWRCRTLALQLDPDEEVRLLCMINVRAKCDPPLPAGYYGNAIVSPAALTTAGELIQNPLGYALELIRKAKNAATHEYIKSVADLMVMKGGQAGACWLWPNYFVSDLAHVKFGEVDFGWGKAAYGGPAKVAGEVEPELTSFFSPFTNNRGEKGRVVPISLPTLAMERFMKELDSMLKDHASMHPVTSTTSTLK